MGVLSGWVGAMVRTGGAEFLGRDVVAAYYRDATEIEIHPNTKTIDDRAFEGCQNLVSLRLNNVETVGAHAFAGCSNLTVVNFGTKLRWVQQKAFRGTGVSDVEFPASVEDVDSEAFSGCWNLETLALNRVKRVRYGAFGGCRRLTVVHFGTSLEEMEPDAFSGSGLTSFDLPDTVHYVGSSAFEGCGSPDFVFRVPRSMEYIQEYAFSGTTMKKVIIPEETARIGEMAFIGADVPEIEFRGTGYWIGEDAFKDTAIETLDLSGAAYIADGAFHECENIRRLYLPKTRVFVKTIFSELAIDIVVIPDEIELISSDGRLFDAANTKLLVGTDDQLNQLGRQAITLVRETPNPDEDSDYSIAEYVAHQLGEPDSDLFANLLELYPDKSKAPTIYQKLIAGFSSAMNRGGSVAILAACLGTRTPGIREFFNSLDVATRRRVMRHPATDYSVHRHVAHNLLVFDKYWKALGKDPSDTDPKPPGYDSGFSRAERREFFALTLNKFVRRD